jgi:mutual gliding-motility protein MglA
MAFVSHQKREIHIKVLLVGPRQSGKTTSMRTIYRTTSGEVKFGLMDFSGTIKPTTTFDFLPISIGQVAGYAIRLHLYSFNPHSPFGGMKEMLISGSDGIIYVLDSSWDAIESNHAAIIKTAEITELSGRRRSDLVEVFQYNKRDLSNAIPLDVMQKVYNADRLPELESTAHLGQGPLECIEILTKAILKKLATGMEPNEDANK